MTIHRGYTTCVLQITAKIYIYTNLCFILGKENHNHELSLSYIECGNHRLNSNIPCVLLRAHLPTLIMCQYPPAVLSKKKKRNATSYSERPFFLKMNPFLLELARNTCFTSTQPLYSSLVGVTCKILVNRFSECVQKNACKEFGLVTH